MNDLIAYNRTNHKTAQGQTIYIQEWFNGIKRYKVKCRSMVLKPKGKLYKVAFVPSWRDLDPAENEKLYNSNPEMFSGHVTACLRQEMLNNNQTWAEREVLV